MLKLRLLFALTPLLALGCGEKQENPTLHPVKGVVLIEGLGPMPGGMIRLHSPANSTYTGHGEIDDHGRFTIVTLRGEEKVEGLPAGEYEVIVLPPARAKYATAQIDLQEKFRITAGENNLAITVPPPGRE